MKKALLVGLTFIVVGFLLVNSTFALPDLDEVFAFVKELGETLGLPEPGGEIVNVALVSDNTPQQLFPGGAASRTTCVRNKGSGKVYFRLVYAIQYNEGSWDKLTIDFDANDHFIPSEWLDITIENIPYKMAVLTYTEALAAGADSPPVTLTIAMDSSITSTELACYHSDFLQTQVLAIDPTPFTEKGYSTAVDALNLALPITPEFNPF